MVTIKYVALVLRADNQGDGGILAMVSLLAAGGTGGRWRPHALTPILVLGLAGTALLVTDGVITPIISVLGALERLETATPQLQPFVLPLTAAILIALFALQRRSTSRISSLFAPVMLAWFTALAALGLP